MNPYGDLCCEEVNRRGELQPCDRPAVALRYDPREEFENADPYAVCAFHSRSPMMPLRDLLSVSLIPVEALIDHARKISPSERSVVYVADLERALGMDAPRPHKLGGNG